MRQYRIIKDRDNQFYIEKRFWLFFWEYLEADVFMSNLLKIVPVKHDSIEDCLGVIENIKAHEIRMKKKKQIDECRTIVKYL